MIGTMFEQWWKDYDVNIRTDFESIAKDAWYAALQNDDTAKGKGQILREKIEQLADRINIGNSFEITKDFSKFELRMMVAALSGKLAGYNHCEGLMQLQYMQYVMAVGLVKKLYAKHLEYGPDSEQYLWYEVKKFLDVAESTENRTSCAKSAPKETEEAQKHLTTGPLQNEYAS